ncbi:MAG TPA: type II toxin-antitoxin system VapC family toxin [Geminicoccaceae bacterium]|nr:type II toxin-antitoxin system VapC family toxin [Geminicoccaceae bacterium]
MNDVVLDASALLAVLRVEPGAERVEPRLEGAGIGAVNLSEVVAKLIENDVPEAAIRRSIGRLELDVHAFEAEHAYVAGILRRSTRGFGLPFGDRACLALAQSLGALALTADRSWSRLDLGIAIEVIR